MTESGLKYQIALQNALNVGLFIDMQTGRDFIRSCSQGKSVLNLFAYTCSFSVAALAGGATRVCNVDMSRSALERGRTNHKLNSQQLDKVQFLPHNILKSLGKLGRIGPFDLVIVDPPTDQGSSFNVVRDYKKIVRRLPEMLAPGGTVLACLNAPTLDGSFLRSMFEEYDFLFKEELRPPPQFKEQKQEAGLKMQLYKFSENLLV